MEYDDYLDQFNIEVGPNGKIGLALADDNETRAWSYFHRLWGHAHDSRDCFDTLHFFVCCESDFVQRKRVKSYVKTFHEGSKLVPQLSVHWLI